MVRQPVKSSNVTSVGYNPNLEILDVEFSNGSVFRYAGFPLSAYTDMMASGSIGSYISKHVRPHYGCCKVEIK